MPKNGKVYSIKTGKKVSNGNTLSLKDYSLKVIYECPEGHLFAEEYYSDQINEYGVAECLKFSLENNEKRYCPECDEMVRVGKRRNDEPK